MMYTNTFQRGMIWGLVGLLVLSALPINIVFAQTVPPTATSSSVVTSSGSSNVTFFGNFSATPEKVKIRIAYDSNFTQIRPEYTFDSASSYVIQSTDSYPFNPGTTYYYKIWATNADGSLSGTAYQWQFTMPGGAPNAPTINTATYSTENLGQREVRLTVTDNATNETYNQLYWHLSGTAWPSTAPKDTYNTSTWSQPANVGSIQITAPATGGTYEYRIDACNTTGCSLSNIVTVIVPSATPGVPTNFHTTASNSGSISLAWNAVSSVDHYVVKWRKGASFNSGDWDNAAIATGSAMNVPGVNNNVYGLIGLDAGSAYYIGIAACSAASACSQPAYLMEYTAAPQSAATIVAGDYPKNFKVASVTANSVSLSWNALTGSQYENAGVSYVLRYKTGLYTLADNSSDADWNAATLATTQPHTGSGIAMTYTVPGLTKGTQYTFGIRTVTSTAKSNIAIFPGKPDDAPAAIAAPMNLSATTITKNSVTFSWTNPSDAQNISGHNVVLKRLSGTSAFVGAADWDAASYVVTTSVGSAGSSGGATATNLAPNTTYSFGLRATKIDGAMSAIISQTVTTLPDSTTSATCTLTMDKPSYPNTATETANYTYTCPSAVTNTVIRVLKPDGSIVVYNSGTSSSTTSWSRSMGFGTSNLLPGVHTLQLCVNDTTCASASIITTSFTITSTTTPPTTGNSGLRVTVKDHADAFVVGATVGLSKSGTAVASGPTSSTGFIEFTKLAAGTYTLGVAPTGRPDLALLGDMTITIGENTTMTQSVVLGKSTGTVPPGGTDIPMGTASIVGYVYLGTTTSTQPVSGIAGLEVMLSRADGKSRRVTTDAQGYYKFSQIDAGDYTLFPYGEDQLGYKQAGDVKKLLAAGEFWNAPAFYLVKDTTIPPPGTKLQCADGLDNDGDGLVDLKDSSCYGPEDNDEYYPVPLQTTVPVISRIEPAHGPIGTTVKVYGTNLHTTENTVRIGAGSLPRIASDGTLLTFIVPAYFEPCPAQPGQTFVCMAVAMPVQPGTYPLSISTPSGISNVFQFSVTSQTEPPIDQCLPSTNEAEWYCAQAAVGAPITVYGKCFLEKMLVWQPNLKYTPGKCASEPPPPPVATGTVKGRVIVRDLTTGTEVGMQTTVRLRPQLVYTFGTAAAQTTLGYTIATSNDGYYSIALQPGSYFVTVDPPSPSHELINDVAVVTIAAGDVRTQNVYFRKVETIPIPTNGGTLTGTVTDYNDKPLVGVDIWVTALSSAPTMNLVRPQRTNEQGIYLVQGIVPGKYRIGATVPLSRNDLMMPKPAEVAVAASIKVVQDFRFEQRQEQGIGLPSGDAYVKGIIKDANGGAVAGAIVQLKRFDGTGFGYVHTDPYGTYVFPNIAAGAYRIGAYPPPLKPYYQSIEEDLEVPSGKVTVKEFTMLTRDGVVPIPIEKGAGTIRGRVLFRDGANEYPMKTNVFLGQYLRGSSVRQSQMTAEDGAFIFTNLVPGTYDLSAGLPTHAAEAAAIARDVDFYKITIAASDEKTQDIIFKRGRIPPPIPGPKEDIEQQYQELRRILIERQQMLKNMTVELQKKGGAEQELRALAEQLQFMIAKADGARKSDDMETLRSLFSELQTLERTIGETIDRLFRGAGNSEFVGRVKSILADAPKYIKEMNTAIEKRERNDVDVTGLRVQLDVVEDLRAKAQALFDAGRVERTNTEEGAGDLAFRMLDHGQALYCALGLGGNQGCAVKFTGPIKTPAYIKTTLGKNAEKDYNAFVKNVAVDSTSQFALESILPTLSPEQMRAMFEIQKGAPSVMRPIVASLEHYDADARAKILETNVDVHTEVQALRESSDALDEVRGISLAARQTVAALRKNLEKFIFPEGVGELVKDQLESFNETIAEGAIKSPKTLEAYVRTFNTSINSYLQQAVQEKYQDGLIPAKNIQETNPLFETALALREQGALNVVLNAKGEVSLNQKMNRKTFVRFLETAADDPDVLAGAAEKKYLSKKTLNGQDVFLLIIDAYDLEVANRIRQNRRQLAQYMSRELGVKVTEGQLRQAVTTSQVIQFVGAAAEKFGGASEEVSVEATQ